MSCKLSQSAYVNSIAVQGYQGYGFTTVWLFCVISAFSVLSIQWHSVIDKQELLYVTIVTQCDKLK